MPATPNPSWLAAALQRAPNQHSHGHGYGQQPPKHRGGPAAQRGAGAVRQVRAQSQLGDGELG